MDTKLQSVLAVSFMKLYIFFINNEELTRHKAIQNSYGFQNSNVFSIRTFYIKCTLSTVYTLLLLA